VNGYFLGIRVLPERKAEVAQGKESKGKTACKAEAVICRWWDK